MYIEENSIFLVSQYSYYILGESFGSSSSQYSLHFPENPSFNIEYKTMKLTTNANKILPDFFFTYALTVFWKGRQVSTIRT